MSRDKLKPIVANRCRAWLPALEYLSLELHEHREGRKSMQRPWAIRQPCVLRRQEGKEGVETYGGDSEEDGCRAACE